MTIERDYSDKDLRTALGSSPPLEKMKMDHTRTDEIILQGYTSAMRNCPFCESTKLVTIRFHGSTWLHCVRCEACGAEGPNIKEANRLSIDDARHSAIEDWNTRT